MNVTAPRAPMDGFFEHHSATHGVLRPRGPRHAGDDVRADRVPQGRLPDRPQGHHPPLRAGRGAALLLDVRVVRRRSREVGGAHHRPVPHPQPQRLPLPALARHAQRGRPLRDRLQGRRRSTRGACTPRTRSTSSAGAATTCRTGSRSRTCGRWWPTARTCRRPPTRSSSCPAATSACSPCARSRRRACGCPSSTRTSTTWRRSATTSATSSARAGVAGPGMVTLHPVGLPHGPKPKALRGVHGRRQSAGSTTRSRSWPTSPIPPGSRSGRSGSAAPTT